MYKVDDEAAFLFLKATDKTMSSFKIKLIEDNIRWKSIKIKKIFKFIS